MKPDPTLHKALLAGTGRVPLTPEAVAGPALQELLASVSADKLLWHSIGAADLWQRAGFEPGQAGASVTAPCPGETVAPRAAEQILQMILRGIHPELLDSWLAHARDANTALPHACLLALVERAMQHKPLRPSVAAVLGQRGRWLVAQHPDWSAAFGVDMSESAPEQSWELGSLAQRVASLHAMRRRDPQAARALLEADWTQETVEHRSALLPCLATGLSLADEAFLERALDDKRKEVRSAAQSLLAGLPGAQLRERCKARLIACVALDHGELKVTLPTELDKAIKRDGIGSQSYLGLGEKAGWLLELVGCVPPAWWSERWQLPSADVIALFAGQEFNTALLRGLARAAARALGPTPDEAAIVWFAALITRPDLTDTMLPDLERLPLQEQERIVTGWLAHAGSNLPAFAYALGWATQRTGALGVAMSQLLLGHLQRHMRTVPKPDYNTGSHLRALARVLDAHDLGYAHANWPGPEWEYWPLWRPLFDDLMETLTFRHTMQASFLENHA